MIPKRKRKPVGEQGGEYEIAIGARRYASFETPASAEKAARILAAEQRVAVVIRRGPHDPSPKRIGKPRTPKAGPLIPLREWAARYERDKEERRTGVTLSA